MSGRAGRANGRLARVGDVSEWRDGEWERFPLDGKIVDDCLAAPLPVSALLRSGELGAAAVRGLLARGEPELTRLLADAAREGEARGEARAEARGDLRGRRATLRAVLEARGFELSNAHLAQIEACVDESALTRWAARAVTATGLDEVLAAG